MRADDYYFKPGDKVVKVSNGKFPTHQQGIPIPPKRPKYGEVYCVEDFWEGPEFNVIMLVGFGGWRYDPFGRPVGWQANAFRKVEEIKLCVTAARHVAQTTPSQLEAVVD